MLLDVLAVVVGTAVGYFVSPIHIVAGLVAVGVRKPSARVAVVAAGALIGTGLWWLISVGDAHEFGFPEPNLYSAMTNLLGGALSIGMLFVLLNFVAKILRRRPRAD